MGGCACSVYEKGVPGNFGGRLQWRWCEGAKCGLHIAERRWCNPMNCSNSACYKKGCSAARADFCAKHGYYCASKKKKVCTSESCPGGALPDCTTNRVEANLTGRPLCTSVKPIQTGPSYKPPLTTPSTKPSGVNADCANYAGLGGFGEWFCIQGKSITKGLQAGGFLVGESVNQINRWMPLMLMAIVVGGTFMLLKK